MQKILKAPAGYKYEIISDTEIQLVEDKRLELLDQLNGEDWFYIKYISQKGIEDILTNALNLFTFNGYYIVKNCLHKPYEISKDLIYSISNIIQILECRLATENEISVIKKLRPDLFKLNWREKLVNLKKDNYYFIRSTPLTGFATSIEQIGDEWVGRKPEHAFATKEQAELVKEKLLLIQEMLAFAHAMNEGWELDWNNYRQAKYGIRLHQQELFTDVLTEYNNFVFGITVKTREIAKQMLEEFSDRIKQYYNQQY